MSSWKCWGFDWRYGWALFIELHPTMDMVQESFRYVSIASMIRRRPTIRKNIYCNARKGRYFKVSAFSWSVGLMFGETEWIIGEAVTKMNFLNLPLEPVQLIRKANISNGIQNRVPVLFTLYNSFPSCCLTLTEGTDMLSRTPAAIFGLLKIIADRLAGSVRCPATCWIDWQWFGDNARAM
jgi:hypothetical protein